MAAAALVVLLVLSVLARRNRRRPPARPTGAGPAAVAALSWIEFERLLGEYFRGRGFTIVESQRGADGGVDLKLAKDGQSVLVHAKRWLMRDVSVQVVREMHGLVRNRSRTRGVVVASGGFTPEARRFAAQTRIELVDGSSLARALDLEQSAAGEPAQPACPLCGGSMSPRPQRRGARAGTQSLGCDDFPKCGGTREVAQ